MLLKDHIVGDIENSDESQSSPKIPIILTSVSPLVVHDDHGGAGKDNNDGLAEQIEQAPPEPPALLVELELRRSTRERRLSIQYPPNEYVMLTNGGEPKCFEEFMSH